MTQQICLNSITLARYKTHAITNMAKLQGDSTMLARPSREAIKETSGTQAKHYNTVFAPIFAQIC